MLWETISWAVSFMCSGQLFRILSSVHFLKRYTACHLNSDWKGPLGCSPGQLQQVHLTPSLTFYITDVAHLVSKHVLHQVPYNNIICHAITKYHKQLSKILSVPRIAGTKCLPNSKVPSSSAVPIPIPFVLLIWLRFERTDAL